MSDPGQPIPRREYAGLVFVLGSLAALSPFAIDAYLPALPAVVDDLRGTMSEGQATVTGVLLGMGVGQLVVGPLADRWGRRTPALIGVAVHVLLSLACVFATSIWVLIGLRFLQGVAGAASTVVAMAVVRDRLTGTPAAVLFSRLLLVVLLAPIVSPLVGGLLLQWTDWRGVFVFLAVMGLVIGLIAWFRLEESLPPERRRDRGWRPVLRAYQILLRDRVVVSMVLVSGLMTSALFVFLTASPFVYQRVYGLSEFEFGVAFAATAVLFGVSSQLNPILVRRWSPGRVLRAMQVMFIVTGVVLVGCVWLFDNFWAFAVPCALALMAFGGVNPNAQAIALHAHGERAGAASALVGAGRFGIAGVVAPVVGAFGEASPMTTALVLLGLGVLGLAVGMVALGGAELES